jgi:hypothetical protein
MNDEFSPIDLDKLRADMRAGLQHVTPGPWDVITSLVIRAIDGDAAIPLFESREPWKKHRKTATVSRQQWHNAHHIARCSPDNIAAILDAIETLATALRPFHEASKDRAETGYMQFTLDDIDAARVAYEKVSGVAVREIKAPEASAVAMRDDVAAERDAAMVRAARAEAERDELAAWKAHILNHQDKKKRPFSDELAQRVIAGQLKRLNAAEDNLAKANFAALDAAARAEKAEAELRTVLEREAATIARHDQRLQKAEAERDELADQILALKDATP